MVQRLFDGSINPNARAFTIPQEEGGTDDDRYVASIGDATMRHVLNLSQADRMLWEDHKPSPSGDIFRFVPSWHDNIRDPENLKDKDLTEHLEQYRGKIPETQWINLVEAIEVERERRLSVAGEDQDYVEDPNDVEEPEMISFDDWEKHPQLWNSVDLPTTPKDVAFYLGNTRQIFYDEFPDGHPYQQVILKYLTIFNRPWPEEITQTYANWVAKILQNEKIPRYLSRTLESLAFRLVDEDNPQELVEKALQAIDRHWAQTYSQQVEAKICYDDIDKLLAFKEQQWQKEFDAGNNVIPQMGKFAQTLFNNYAKKMNGSKWDVYFKLKKQFAPRILFNNIDLNRAPIHELKSYFTNKRARDIFHERPFSSLNDAYNKKCIQKKDFAQSEDAIKMLDFIERHYTKASNENSFKRFADVGAQLLDCQKRCKDLFTSEQWALFWNYYRINKSNLTQQLKAKKNDP